MDYLLMSMSLVKWIIIICLCVAFILILLLPFSNILKRKPKTNKLRQWWSENLVDLDDRFFE